MSLIIELPSELEEQLRRQADERGQSLSNFMRPALEALVHAAPQPSSAVESDAEAETPAYLQAFLAAAEALAQQSVDFPEGGAQEIDHYVYGLPKRGEARK